MVLKSLETMNCKIDILFSEVDSIKKMVNDNINIIVRDASQSNESNKGDKDSHNDRNDDSQREAGND